jgi:hypothetical protein
LSPLEAEFVKPMWQLGNVPKRIETGAGIRHGN